LLAYPEADLTYYF